MTDAKKRPWGQWRVCDGIVEKGKSDEPDIDWLAVHRKPESEITTLLKGNL
ncbi:hypothetical protein AB4037_31160 [Labrys sp. KB_33_2]|uniref:hypothetical protein n=1 Tax=Labrys sp. KB_33_2 TaxID=3237479 RepID=UPI003F904E6C